MLPGLTGIGRNILVRSRRGKACLKVSQHIIQHRIMRFDTSQTITHRVTITGDGIYGGFWGRLAIAIRKGLPAHRGSQLSLNLVGEPLFSQEPHQKQEYFWRPFQLPTTLPKQSKR